MCKKNISMAESRNTLRTHRLPHGADLRVDCCPELEAKDIPVPLYKERGCVGWIGVPTNEIDPPHVHWPSNGTSENQLKRHGTVRSGTLKQVTMTHGNEVSKCVGRSWKVGLQTETSSTLKTISPLRREATRSLFQLARQKQVGQPGNHLGITPMVADMHSRTKPVSTFLYNYFMIDLLKVYKPYFNTENAISVVKQSCCQLNRACSTTMLNPWASEGIIRKWGCCPMRHRMSIC